MKVDFVCPSCHHGVCHRVTWWQMTEECQFTLDANKGIEFDAGPIHDTHVSTFGGFECGRCYAKFSGTDELLRKGAFPLNTKDSTKMTDTTPSEKDFIKTYVSRINVILGHFLPDLDCFSSMKAMYNYLNKTFPGTENIVFVPNVQNSIGWAIEGCDIVSESGSNTFASRINEILDIKGDADVEVTIWSVDTGNKSRVLGLDIVLERLATDGIQPKIIRIDHHEQSHEPFEVQDAFVDPTASSCCEILYRLMAPNPDARDCTALLVGHLADTGGLCWCKSDNSYIVAIDLLKQSEKTMGEIMDKIRNNWTIQDGLMVAKIISATTTDKGLFYAFLTDADMVEVPQGCGQLTQQHVAGKTEFLTRYADCKLAILGTPLPDNRYRLEFRSKGDIDVATIAKAFGGGGHKNAAGAILNKPYGKYLLMTVVNTARYALERNNQ